MNPILQNVLAVIGGAIIGGIVNISIVNLNPVIFELPGDISSMEALAETMALFEPKHFLMPFLGHAIGTLVGAFIAAKFGASQNMILAYVIGGFFLLGGITMVMSVPSPMWFNVTDLVLAYIPMAWLGGTLAMRT